MSLLNNGQSQQAGDNSTQIQNNVGTQIINQGLSVMEVQALINEKIASLEQNIQKQIEPALSRWNKFLKSTLPLLNQAVDLFDELNDPSILNQVVKARQKVIFTDSDITYDLIANILISRIENKKDQEKSLYASKALDVIDELPSTTLNALTAYYILSTFAVPFITLESTIIRLENTLKSIDITQLPLNETWIDHLSMLQLCDIDRLNHFKKMEEILPIFYSNFAVVGVKKGTEEYNDCLNLLSGLSSYNPCDILIDNPLLDGYSYVLKVNIDKKPCYACKQENVFIFPPITNQILNVIGRIENRYDKRPELIQQVKSALVEKFRASTRLSLIFDWWNQISVYPRLNGAGKLIAHINAKRLGLNLPKEVL
jgi:hypothetical protein